MLEAFAGCPAVVVPDNLRSSVTRACRYEPTINRSYLEFARHYGLAVVPARSGRPRDKGRRVASHRRLTGRGQPSTQPEHMPHAHRAHAEWTPLRPRKSSWSFV